MSRNEPAPLLVFSDDWGRHPSSCQHLISLLVRRRSAAWVNTIGTRPLSLSWSTARRGIEKLRHWAGVPRPARQHAAVSGPAVLNPKMWPSFRSRLGRGLNRRLLERALRPTIEAMPRPPVVVTTIPLIADLIGRLPAERWAYYCVDDFGVWPGLDGRTLRDMERELAAKADVCIAVSETLQAHLAALGRPSHLLTHGVDLAHWQRPTPTDLPASLGAFAAVSRPWVVFWGVVDRRMDLAFVRRLGERMTAGTILLVGPQDAPDPELLRLPRVRAFAPLPYDDLPALAAAAAVLVMPYVDAPVTRAMQPLKLKEYMATGRPTVVRDLPATRPWADCLDAADAPDRFAEAVLDRLRDGLPASQQSARTARLGEEGWDAKAALFERWIDGG